MRASFIDLIAGLEDRRLSRSRGRDEYFGGMQMKTLGLVADQEINLVWVADDQPIFL